MRDTERAVILVVLATVGGFSFGWSVWAATSGNVREGANNFNLAVAATSFFLIAVALGVRTRSGEWPWHSVLRAVRGRPLAIISGVLATAGGFFLVWWLVAVTYDVDWPWHTGIASLVLFGAALGLLWGSGSEEQPSRLVQISALVGAALWPLFFIFILFNFYGE